MLRTDAHRDTPHRTRSLRFVGDWCGCCILICDSLVDWVCFWSSNTNSSRQIEKLVNAVLSRISQRNEWRLSGLFALFVWVFFVLSICFICLRIVFLEEVSYGMDGLLLLRSRSLVNEGIVKPDLQGFVRRSPGVAWSQRCVRSSGLWSIYVPWSRFFPVFSSFHLRWSREHTC